MTKLWCSQWSTISLLMNRKFNFISVSIIKYWHVQVKPSDLYPKSLCKYRNELTLCLTIMVISIGFMSPSLDRGENDATPVGRVLDAPGRIFAKWPLVRAICVNILMGPTFLIWHRGFVLGCCKNGPWALAFDVRTRPGHSTNFTYPQDWSFKLLAALFQGGWLQIIFYWLINAYILSKRRREIGGYMCRKAGYA